MEATASTSRKRKSRSAADRSEPTILRPERRTLVLRRCPSCFVLCLETELSGDGGEAHMHTYLCTHLPRWYTSLDERKDADGGEGAVGEEVKQASTAGRHTIPMEGVSDTFTVSAHVPDEARAFLKFAVKTKKCKRLDCKGTIVRTVYSGSGVIMAYGVKCFRNVGEESAAALHQSLPFKDTDHDQVALSVLAAAAARTSPPPDVAGPTLPPNPNAGFTHFTRLLSITNASWGGSHARWGDVGILDVTRTHLITLKEAVSVMNSSALMGRVREAVDTAMDLALSYGQHGAPRLSYIMAFKHLCDLAELARDEGLAVQDAPATPRSK